jgi:hypothetical protein
VLELSFVYGSLIDGDLILLDGQQRLTTLFLLHWYIFKRENVELPTYMSHFVYETRHTSTDFLHKITSQEIAINDTTTPRKAICKNKWFTIAFEEDPTVESMLIMLDSIDSYYNKSMDELKKTGVSMNLHDELDRLMFYVLPLENFGLTDELYIKMNARGLFLVPFENFKADLVKYLRRNTETPKKEYQISGNQIPFNQYFPIKLDNSYIDLFWDKNSPNEKKYYHLKYFRFFYRYMSAMLSWNSSLAATMFTKSDDFLFFDKDSEENQNERYLGFEYYQKNLSLGVLEDMNHILSQLCVSCTEIKNKMKNPWDGEWDLFEDNAKFQRTHRVAFAAIVDYLRIGQKFDEENFRRWMRVVWNVIENSNIDGPVPQVNTIRTLHSLINLGASSDVYGTLSNNYQLTNATPRALREEVLKAKQIIEQPNVDWEEKFTMAEAHPFFKGMIGFFFDYGMDLPQFMHRYEIVSQMFNEKGIVPSLRKEHLLIRAMMSCLNSWDDLNELSFTERNEQGNFLKLMLASKQKLWNFFKKILDKASSMDEIPMILASRIHDTLFDSNNSMEPNLRKAYDRLVHDVYLYNWISDTEEEHNWYFRIYATYGHYFAAVPRKWYARMVIDTDRNYIIPMLMHEFKFTLEDSDEKRMYKMYKKYRDFYGNDINIIRTFQNGNNIIYLLKVSFSLNHIVRYTISSLNGININALFDIVNKKKSTAYIDGEEINVGNDTYSTISDFTKIEKGINDVIHLVSTLP